EAAFGVGIDDLDGLSRHRLDDVARPLGFTVWHVFTKPDCAHYIDLRFARRERMQETDDAGGSGHVALHVLHVLRRLDREPAAIKAHPLADESDRIDAALAAVPAHDHEPCFVRGTLADPKQRAHAKLAHGGHVKHLDAH